MTVPTYTLNDGVVIPQIGLGTYPLRGEEGITAMVSALEAGYRLIDSAVNYENEQEVGEAIRRSGVPREEIVVTTKIPGRFHARDEAVSCVEESLRVMGLEQIDLVLVHWPNPSVGKYVEAFQALVTCRERGLVRSVGVSNHSERHLQDVIGATGVVPAVNQIELHPAFPQEKMLRVHGRMGIVTESWSPVARMKRVAPQIEEIAAAHQVSSAQVILRWHLQRGCLPLPKSADPVRQKDNLDLFNFELSAEEIVTITGLGRPDGRQWGYDPDTHEEM
ncbi:Aldo/keto reductase [Austwickia chelonae]|uniref:Putative aldo/keto reductase n=1 Tax=Austwickia chelonae NBRC 105200 TaxID=1184607 RepID=K6VQU4_9MICO|nr:aldo/keto reductase [Austwickia chelonae]GAB79099.1 putative aldo/keto reductase [Austwickia chelonae NBRC 105200]SEW42246.1 Aldo/keto reductase [Austwickia chelonae]